ncbi:TonB-dependent receptor [uncultured Pseudoteredinibacter sp.]|uniref:TonB-dependent receptor n=1 Tax=uncultured Pseudoteredinibacter sp. TaxID=1641701 RepID=UPI002634A23E|nr:TonB-dependent receptor [uncultured Pseudoteredinibacter sp.]
MSRYPAYRPAILSLAISQILIGNANAQSNAPKFALEEVVVTAQKREQNVMDVPIAIDNYSSKDIENTGALLLEDIADYIPGFEAGGALTQSTLTIRGVASSNISSGGDASVATFYDGVYLPRSATTIAFSDMARIEVLKGPQGTLAGRNAAAGSVNIVPNRPQLGEQEGFVKLKAGNYDFQRWEAMINQPLSENVAVRANLMLNQRDGYIDNVVSGGADIDAKDMLTGRLALLWELSSDTRLQLSADFDDSDNGPAPSVGYSAFSHNRQPTSAVVANDVINGQETRDMYSLGYRLEHDINEEWSLAWWANYRDLDTTNRQDEDGGSHIDRYLDTDNIETSELFYTELQLNFSNERFKYVGGFTYSSEDKSQTTQINTTADTAANLATQVSNGLLAAAGAGFSIDSIWDPTGWAMLTGALDQLAGGALGTPLDQSTASYNGVLGFLYASPFAPQIQPFSPILAAGFIAPSYSGQLFTEEVRNTGEFVNWGVYSDIDISVTDDFNLIFGLRYSKDEKDFTWFNATAPLATQLNQERAALAAAGLQVAALIPQATNLLSPLSQQGVGLVTDRLVSAKDSWSKTTGRAIAQYRLNDKAMVFASYSTGYTSGGFDSFVVNTAQQPLSPEEVSNIELGIKADWLNDRLRTRLNFFDMSFENRQRSVFSADPNIPGFSAPIIIAGDEDIEGWELVMQWLPTDNIQLGLVSTSRETSSRYGEYIDANGNQRGGDQESADTLDEYTFTFDWAFDAAQGQVNLHVDYVFKEQQFDENDAGYLPEYEQIENFGDDRKFLNARIAWRSQDERYGLALWGQNLLDNRYTSIPGGLAASDLASPTVSLTEPRTYGIDFEYRF